MSRRFFSSLFAAAVMMATPLMAVAAIPAPDPGVHAVQAFEPATESISPGVMKAATVPAVVRPGDARARVVVINTRTGEARQADRSGVLHRIFPAEPVAVPWPGLYR